MSQDLWQLPIAEAAPLLRERKLSPVELTAAYLDRIAAVEGKINAFITLDREGALQAATEAEKTIGRGEYKGPLHGVPVGLKDLFNTRGLRTTVGTTIMSSNVPEDDCAVALKLKQAGAILLGKMNMVELALGPSGDNPHYGDVRNPWKSGCMSGGSSSGSAASVAVGECAAALGSDTGGSIRIPAALSGVVGLKPTFGRISLYGVYPLCWSLDHVGPLTRTVADCAIVLSAIAGYDARDPTSADVAVPDFTASLEGDIRSLRIGLPLEHAWEILSGPVRSAGTQATETLGKLGAKVRDVSLPAFSQSMDVSGAIMGAEALVADGQLLKDHGERLSPRVRQRLAAGASVTAEQYVRALQARARMVQETRELLRTVDVLALPTCAVVAPPYGASEVEANGAKLGITAALTLLTRFANLTGLPAISVPCGFSADGLPIGLQFIGRPFDEAAVLRVAHAYEEATEWHTRRPVL